VTRARLDHELVGPEGAPVLVLANSLGTTTAVWDPQLPAFRERFRVLRYDHRGHGRSEVPVGPYAVGDLGQDVLGLLDELGVERASFCGMSLGGMVGAWLAAFAPERIDRLALCCSAARLEPASQWLERAARVRAAGTASVAEQVVTRWFTPAFRRRSPEVVARTVAMLAGTPDEGYAGCCEAIAGMDLRAALPAVIAPTLVLAGGADPVAPPSLAAELVTGVRHGRLVVVDDAAHLASLEQPERVTGLLLDHLASLEPPG
jgi:3-oxoadipate enol-lactonase